MKTDNAKIDGLQILNRCIEMEYLERKVAKGIGKRL